MVDFKNHNSNFSLKMYIDDIEGGLLTAKEEKELFTILKPCQEELHRTRLKHECPRCVNAKKKIVEKNLRYVVKIAKQYIGRGRSLEDMVQDGNLGLMKAMSKFDVDRGYRFTTYATWWIRQNITREIGCKVSLIRIPLHKIAALMRVYVAFRRENKAATAGDFIAHIEESDVDIQTVRDAMIFFGNFISIDGGIEPKDNGRENNRINLQAVLTNEDDKNNTEFNLIKKSVRLKVLGYVERLPDVGVKEVLSRRFGILEFEEKPQTLDFIGKKLGVTRERIRQIEKKGLKQLAREMERNIEDLEIFEWVINE